MSTLPSQLIANPNQYLKLSLSCRTACTSIELPPILCKKVVRLISIWSGSKFGEVKIVSEAYKTDKIKVLLYSGETLIDYIAVQEVARYRRFLARISELHGMT